MPRLSLRNLLFASLAFFMVECSWYLRPDFSPGVEHITCKDGYAWRIPDGEDFAGRYVPCEAFDDFYTAVDQGFMKRAEGLLLGR